MAALRTLFIGMMWCGVAQATQGVLPEHGVLREIAETQKQEILRKSRGEAPAPTTPIAPVPTVAAPVTTSTGESNYYQYSLRAIYGTLDNGSADILVNNSIRVRYARVGQELPGGWRIRSIDQTSVTLQKGSGKNKATAMTLWVEGPSQITAGAINPGVPYGGTYSAGPGIPAPPPIGAPLMAPPGIGGR